MEEAFRGLKKIGQGASGVVYSAWNRITRERVALKMVIKNSEMSRFEVQCLIPYPYPSIIKLKELVLSRVNNHIGYLVLELTKGGDLSSLACDFEREGEVLDEERIRNIMHQLLEGIVHLHSKGIIHGDLKTDNLLLISHERQLKIRAFSHSIHCRTNTSYFIAGYNNTIGTLWYHAPKILTSKEDATIRYYSTSIDLWAAGCIIGELLCREPLFKGRSWSDQYSKILDILGPDNST